MLAIATIIFTYGLAIPIGIYSAIRQYSLGDYAATIVGYFGMATPSFMLALILLYFSVMVFNNSVGGLFSSQYAEAPWNWAKFVDLLRHLWVPALVLGLAAPPEIRTMRHHADEKNKLYVNCRPPKACLSGSCCSSASARSPPTHCQYDRLGTDCHHRRAPRFVRAGPAGHRSVVSQGVARPGYLPVSDPAHVLRFDHPGHVSVGRAAGLLDPRIRYGERV
jgi:hypothetical protein